MKIFVSKKDENKFYGSLVEFYSTNEEIIIYDRNLYNLFKKAFRLFDHADLDR